jgi:hypothetical protein
MEVMEIASLVLVIVFATILVNDYTPKWMGGFVIWAMKKLWRIDLGDTEATQKTISQYVFKEKISGGLATYYIGECYEPRSHPELWCDRMFCEGFWNDKKMTEKIVNMLNGEKQV